MTEDYTFSVRVYDDEGRRWGQEDKFPGDNSYPTSAWDPGDLVIEKFYPGLDPCAPAGKYQLTVQAYNPKTNQDLYPASRRQQSIALGSIQVEASQGNRLQDLSPARSLNVRLTPQLQLVGLTELSSGLRAGESLSLELFWKGTGNGVKPSISLGLRDSSGANFKLADQTFSLPGAGRGLCTLIDSPTPSILSAGTAQVLLNGTPIDSITITR